MNNDEKKFDRRRALTLLSTSVLAAGGIIGLAACKKDGDEAKPGEGSAPAGEGCNAPIDAKSKQIRKTQQYTDKSPFPDKKCSSCSQFLAAKFAACGGCKLFEGPVQPAGYCASYAPLAGATPSGPVAPAHT